MIWSCVTFSVYFCFSHPLHEVACLKVTKGISSYSCGDAAIP